MSNPSKIYTILTKNNQKRILLLTKIKNNQKRILLLTKITIWLKNSMVLNAQFLSTNQIIIFKLRINKII